MIHVVEMIRGRHPQHAGAITNAMLVLLALLLAAGIALLLR